MTTVREATDETVRTARRIMALAFFLLAGCEVWFVLHPDRFVWPLLVLGIVSALGLAGALYYCVFAFRCAVCRTRWYPVSTGFPPFRLHRHLRYCPFCGVSLDDDANAHRAQ